jgi:diguanylate cyclase (GGDEF)-like protein
VGYVPLTVGLPVAALICACAAVPAVGLLSRTAARAGRFGYLLMILGIGTSAVGVAAGAALARRSDPLWLLALCQTLGVLLLLTGLLRVPAIAAERGAGPRLVLDGAVIAACTVQIGWTLFAGPALVRHTGQVGLPVHDPRTFLLGIPLLTALTAAGVAGVAARRPPRPRRVLALCAVSIAATALAGLGLLLAVRYGGGPATVLVSGGFGLGLVLVALTARRTERLAAPIPGPPGTGLPLALVAAGLTVAALAVRIVWLGAVDNVSVLLVAVVAGLIAARQVLANRAAHRYAHRLVERESQFKEMAYTDALTGLGNRRNLMRALSEDVVAGDRSVLLAIDLDGFKNVNDVRGHDVGDAVLVEVGRRLRANLRPGDLAARLGGDEFAVLMWAGPEEAYRVAQRLLAVLGEGYDVDGSPVYLSASIGLAGGDTAGDVPTLLHNADLSLRFAKLRGKRRVERYDAAYDQWMRRRTLVEQELRGAIERAELSLAYQPIVSLPDGRPVGVEALVRWRHPGLGQVPPTEFIPVAEEFGLIARIDRWVLHQACHQLARWMSDGHDPWLSVNVSVRELHLPDFVPQLIEVLHEHHIPPERLVLDVAEHAVATDLTEAVERLAELRRHGVRIALDDLGAGLCALGQLRRFPVDLIKMDRLLLDEPAAPLVQVVVALGRQLGLEVVAEGVATPAQREVVEAAGGQLAQGELFGAPMPAEHLEALLAGPVMLAEPPSAQDMGQVDAGHEMRQS